MNGQLTIGGQTWDEWVADQFEYECCHECGGDVPDHDPVILMGNWFARCQDGES